MYFHNNKNSILLLFSTYFLIGLFLTSLTACEEELPQSSICQEFGDCFIFNVAKDESIGNCKIYSGPDTIPCQEIKEEIFRLSFDDQLWLPYSCCDSEDKIIYVNDSGAQLPLMVLDKKHDLLSLPTYSSEQCPTDTSHLESYCLTYERAYVILSFPVEIDTNNTFIRKNIHINLDIYFSINSHDSIEANKIRAGSLINIRTHSSNRDSNFNQASVFRHTTDRGNLPVSRIKNAKFYNSIELVGKRFQNVYNFEHFMPEENMSFYYSKELGIVSFTDNETGIQWRLSDEHL